jgi:hypothetical protein
MWQRMIEVNGVGHSRFGRLTWDGGGAADIVYFDTTSNELPYFPTGNRHEDEVFQHLWSGGGIAFYDGTGSSGVSEWEYIRNKFIGPMQAGIFLVNANVLDHWVWDSLFQNTQFGVTNFVPGRPGGAGGDWGVNRSVFLNNGNDLAIGNTQAFFSSRWNYSRGSQVHALGGPIGRASSAWTSQGETVLDYPDSPIVLQNVGPLGVLDGVFRGGKPQGQMGVFEAYCNSDCSGDLWAIGNTFSNTSPYQYFTPPAPTGRGLHAYIDDKNGQTITDPGPPALPPTPRRSTARVIEVTGGDIGAALAKAGTSRAIVHIPYGTYDIHKTLEVGPNVILTGDGYGATQLHSVGADPILHLAGPSHAVVRDLSLQGWDGNANRRIASGLVIDNADQTGGLVHAEHSAFQRSDRGWDVANLSQTTVDLFDDQNGANTHMDQGGANPSVDYRVSSARLHIFNGAGAGSDAIYELHAGELVSQTHYFEGNPGGSPAALVVPGSSGTLVLDAGNFAPTFGGIDTSTFRGLFTLTNFGNTLPGDSTALTARQFGPNSLVMGLFYGSPAEATPPTFTGAPYALWLPRRINTQGSDLVADQQAGIPDEAQFMRDHLAPLRAARPLSLMSRPTGVTDVRLYRVGGELLKSGVRVLGTPRAVQR